MIRPDPLDDMQLDQLLGAHRAPPLSDDFARRVIAEAAREDRVPTLPPLRPRDHRTGRPWTRRGLVVAVVAVNLIVASAIAATFSGRFPALQHVATAMARVLHLPHHRSVSRPLHVAHAAVPRTRPAVIVAPVPPPETPAPAQIFADRHPLVAMRQAGLLPPRPLVRRRAILFAERHPIAAHALVRRARLRALAEARAIPPAELREERPAPERLARERPAGAVLSRVEAASQPRARLEEREAFERERRELEQRANAEWPVKPTDIHEKPAEMHDKAANAAEKKPARPAALHPKWRERQKMGRQGRRGLGHPGRRRAL